MPISSLLTTITRPSLHRDSLFDDDVYYCCNSQAHASRRALKVQDASLSHSLSHSLSYRRISNTAHGCTRAQKVVAVKCVCLSPPPPPPQPVCAPHAQAQSLTLPLFTEMVGGFAEYCFPGPTGFWLAFAQKHALTPLHVHPFMHEQS